MKIVYGTIKKIDNISSIYLLETSFGVYEIRNSNLFDFKDGEKIKAQIMIDKSAVSIYMAGKVADIIQFES